VLVISHILVPLFNTQVLNLAADVLKRVPDVIDYEATLKNVADDMSPLNVVLLQEVSMHHHVQFVSMFTFRFRDTMSC